MANSIQLAKQYMTLLDEVYKQASLTADLDGAAELMRAGYNANEIVIPKLSMDGLGNYSRNDGYVKGDATLTYETVSCGFDRGRKFAVDDLDNVETGGVAFGRLAGEFVRTKVVPELDAYRFSQYASTANIGSASGALKTGEAVVTALRKALDEMDEAEVPYEGRLLYITPGLIGSVQDLDTTKSRAVLAEFSKIVKVPQTRFYTKIKQNDGVTTGQTAGGYAKDTSGLNINFMVIHPSALMQFNKQVKPKILSPDVNPDGDSWIYGYRLVSLADVYENKAAGIYCHHASASA